MQEDEVALLLGDATAVPWRKALGPGGWRGLVTSLRTVDSNTTLPVALHHAEELHSFAKGRA